VFVNQAGRPLDARRFRRLVEQWSRQAGIDPVVHPYALRHFFASWTLAQGAHLETVADLLGHADTSTAQRHYLSRTSLVLEGTDAVADLLRRS
jgi:integrase/recombinase XerD